jgi:RimJ/RimL family protein N-acetyltransferase
MRLTRLRPAVADDARLLWEWANDPQVRASAFNSEPIGWDGHLAWFTRKLRDEGCMILLALSEADAPVGQIRFDRAADGSVEIDVSVAPEQRGQGLGSELIRVGVREYLDRTGATHVDAWIKASNFASRRAFESAGFSLLATDDAHGEPVRHYRSYGDHGRD